MNRQFSREEVQKILQRWHQLRQQFGEQAVNVPEFNHLSKIIKFLQQQNQQSMQRKNAPQEQASVPQPQKTPSFGFQQSMNATGNNLGSVNKPSGQQIVNLGPSGNSGQAPPQPPQPQHGQPMNFPVPGGPQMMGPHTQFQNVKQMPPNNVPPTASNVQNGSESAFSPQQVQLLKAQFQVLKFLLKTSGPNSPSIPQNLIDFATNDRLSFPGGVYLPANNISKQSQGASPALNNQGMVHPQEQQPAAFNQSPNMIAPRTQGPTPQAMKPNTMNQRNPVMGNVPTPPQDDLLKDMGRNARLQPPKPRATSQTMSISNPQSRRSSSGKATPLSSTNKQKFVCYPPAPPQKASSFINKNKNDKTIVPINKPNIQVDCFEVPDIMGDKFKDFTYTSLFSNTSRIQIPSLLPDGIEVDDVMNNREALIVLQIYQRALELKKKLESCTEEERLPLEIELKKLILLPQQKQLKGKVLSHLWFSKTLLPNSHPNFLAKFSNISFDDVTLTHELYKQQLYSIVQAQNKKHQTTVNVILENRTARNDVLFNKRERISRITNRIMSFHTQIAKEEQKKIERMAKQRLQALKLNDEEAYLKLLDHTKDTRITHILKQTNQFLDSLAQAVQTQQRETRDRMNNDGRIGKDNEDDDKMTDEERREKMDYYHVAHRIKEDVTKQPSILIGGTLKEYQLKGLQWMVSLFNNHLNGILADEMGLGKTIQTISLLTYLVEVKQIPGHFLVIVPLSTLTNWNLEFEKWAPALKKITYKGTPYQRKLSQHDIKQGNFQVLLTTFEYVIKDRNLLSKIRWVHMIIDEGHRMKNSSSKLSETLTHHYHSDYRLILTGTPLQNNLPELWALLNFVLPKIFNSVKSFDEWFNTPFANTGGQDKIELSEEETLLVIRRLHKVLRPFLLRRLKKDVEKDLPNKVEKVIKCKMSSLQSKLYQQMLKHNVLFASDPETGKPVTIKNTNNQIMQLRKICNHPFVYEEVEYLINPTAETNDIIWRVAGKFELLDRILPKFKRTGHRVLIFFQMTQIMDIMEDFLRLRGMKYMRLDGATKADDRTGLLNQFNSKDSEYFCFLLSTRAGGLGLNLQTADTVIIFDTDWNPHQDLQAQDRAHRIGQKNEVRILRLITEDSVEEMILERAYAKLEIDGKVIQAGKFDNKSTAEEQEALLRALIEKEEERKQKGFSGENEELDDDELNQLIARNDGELVVFKELDDMRATETKESSYSTRLFSESELPEVYKQDIDSLVNKDVIVGEYGRGTRERKTTKYDDNLTEEQWLKQIDGVLSESDDEMGSKPRKKRGRPKTHSPMKEEEKLDGSLLNDSDSNSKKRRPGDVDGGDSFKRQRAEKSTARARTTKNRIRNKGMSDILTEEEREILQDKMQQIYDVVISCEEDDRNLSDLFLVKPSRKLYPDYYVLIRNPIALDTIKKRLQNKSYYLIREYLEDLHLMFSNARIYNEEGSLVYEDSVTLERIAFKKFREVYDDADPEEIDQLLNFQDFDKEYKLEPLAIGVPTGGKEEPNLPGNNGGTQDVTDLVNDPSASKEEV